MGRKVRCYFDVDDPETFVQAVKDYLLDEGGYRLERDNLPDVLIVEAGDTAWTVIGTHRWGKTSRTVIVSVGTDVEEYNVEFLYDVSWLAIHFRPQRKIRTEIDDMLDGVDVPDVEYDLEYEIQV
jgi:hypothetical protein